MDAGVVCEKPFFVSVEEIGAVVDRCLFAWGSTKDFGTPSIPTSKSQRRIEGKETQESYKWLSKCITLIGPYARLTLRRSGRVIV